MTLAAVDARQIRISGEPGLYPTDELAYGNADALLDSMADRGISILLVHRSALNTVLPLPSELENGIHPWFEDCDVDHRSLAPAFKRGDLEVQIGAYQHGVGDPFAAAGNATALLEAHEAFADSLDGWWFRHSASSTGWSLMHTPWTYGRRKRSRQAALDGAFLPPVQPRLCEIPWGAWVSPIYRRRLAYVHGYDIHGQRLAACSRLQLGVGEPVEGGAAVTSEQIAARLKLPGYHFVASIQSMLTGMAPPPFEEGWHTTSRLALGLQAGVRFRIVQSFTYPDSLPYLDPFYERIRDGRNVLLKNHTRPGARLALGALKQCYLQPLGRLASTRAEEQGSVWYRPDWYDSVIGRELGIQWLRMQQLAAAGVRLIGVYYDTLLIESDTEDSIAAAPPTLPLHASQLGKFRPIAPKGAPATEVWELLNERHLGAAVARIKDTHDPEGDRVR